MVSSHSIPSIAILRIFLAAIQQTHQVGRGMEKTKKATENDIERKECSQKSNAPHIISSMFFFPQLNLGFSWSSDNITVSKKKSTSRKEPTSLSKITISYLHKNIIILLFCQCGLSIHTCVSKNSVVSKDLIFSFNITWCDEAAIYAKKSSFLSFYSFLVKFIVNSTGKRWSKINKKGQSWMGAKNAIMQTTYF